MLEVHVLTLTAGIINIIGGITQRRYTLFLTVVPLSGSPLETLRESGETVLSFIFCYNIGPSLSFLNTVVISRLYSYVVPTRDNTEVN